MHFCVFSSVGLDGFGFKLEEPKSIIRTTPDSFLKTITRLTDALTIIVFWLHLATRDTMRYDMSVNCQVGEEVMLTVEAQELVAH